MKSRSKNHFLLLISGWIVFLVPIIFVHFLVNTSLTRYRNSTESLLREKLLITSERITQAFEPEGFVKTVIQDAHQEVMPEVVPEIINMIPSEDFGSIEFSSTAPEKFKEALKSRNIAPLIVNIYSRHIENTYFWMDESFKKQITDESELKSLILSFKFKALLMFEFLYPQLFQKPPPFVSLSLKTMFQLYSFDHDTHSYRYISRFSPFFFGHEKLSEVFTDYFGQQLLYIYSYCCLSEKGQHGAYSIIIPQTSIKSDDIISRVMAVVKSESGRLQILSGENKRVDFFKTSDGMSYTFAPPTKFLNHLLFEQKMHSSKKNSVTNAGAMTLKLFLPWPEGFRITQKNAAFAIKSAWVFFATGILLSLLFMRFDLPFTLSLQGKLATILCIIFFIPAAGTISMITRILIDSDRLLEMRLQDFTANSLELARNCDTENKQRAMLSSHMTKIAIENSESNNYFSFINPLATSDPQFSWFRNWTTSISLIDSTSFTQSFDNLGNLIALPSSLLIGMLKNFHQNLGLAESGKLQLNAEALKMGFIESYLSPEMQERIIPHEGTIQQEIISAADTSLNTFLVCLNRNHQPVSAIHRILLNNRSSNAYLSEMRNPGYQFYNRSDKYSQIELAAKMRKSLEYDKEAWVNRSKNFTRLELSFAKALANRESGRYITRSFDEIECNSWNFMRESTLVFAATAQGSTQIIETAAIIVWFLIYFGYLALLLFIINRYFTQIANGPMEIFHEGISALKNEQFGVTIKQFSQDEFNSVTQAFNAMSLALKQKEMIKRYIPEKLVEEVESDFQDACSFKQSDLTLLSSDIRGFTTLSERYNPAEIVDMLNSYFTAMELAIKKYDGTINKYIGDAIEAVFLNSTTQQSAINACKAAKEMRRSLEILNSARKETGQFMIENGIGIVSGTAGYGTTGSKSGRKDYAIIGEITEIANSLEALTKDSTSKVLICHKTAILAESEIQTRVFSAEVMELLCD